MANLLCFVRKILRRYALARLAAWMRGITGGNARIRVPGPSTSQGVPVIEMFDGGFKRPRPVSW